MHARRIDPGGPLCGVRRAPLVGLRILIVEDEALVALDLEMTLQAEGAETVGPCLRLDHARSIIEKETLDVAVLDISLGRETTYGLANRLCELLVPLVFHSGHGNSTALSQRYPRSGYCPKPCTPNTIVRTVVRAIEGRS